MGIKGLWKVLHPYVTNGHISQFKEKRVAVDMYVWLHRCVIDSTILNLTYYLQLDSAALEALFSEVEQQTQDDAAEDEEGVASAGPTEDATDDDDDDDDDPMVEREGGGSSSGKDEEGAETIATFSTQLDIREEVGLFKQATQHQEHRPGGEGAAIRTEKAASPSPSTTSPAPQSSLQRLNMLKLIHVSPRFLQRVMQWVDLLLTNGVVPLCVFDGRPLPLKEATEAARHRNRLHQFRCALQLLAPYREGLQRAARVTALPNEEASGSGFYGQVERFALSVIPTGVWERVKQHLHQSLDITTELAREVVEVLREQRGVECLVSPYESDAQLSYLCRESLVTACVTEDSDLIAYFCPCVIAKLDRSGRCCILQPPTVCPLLYGEVVRSPNSAASRRSRAAVAEGTGEGVAAGSGARKNEFSYDLFLVGCIMAGCDYTKNISGVGITRALRILSQSRGMKEVREYLASYISSRGTAESTEAGGEGVDGYVRRLYAAYSAFRYHIVYDPRAKALASFTPIPSDTSDDATGLADGSRTPQQWSVILGAKWEDAVAVGVCETASLDPETLAPYQRVYCSCSASYLTEFYAGQRRLTDFNGFNQHRAARVVVRPGSGGTGTGGGVTSIPYCGRQATAPGTSGSQHIPTKVLLRSKFLRCGAARGGWSAVAEGLPLPGSSDSEEDDDDDVVIYSKEADDDVIVVEDVKVKREAAVAAPTPPLPPRSTTTTTAATSGVASTTRTATTTDDVSRADVVVVKSEEKLNLPPPAVAGLDMFSKLSYCSTKRAREEPPNSTTNSSRIQRSFNHEEDELRRKSAPAATTPWGFQRVGGGGTSR